MVARSSLGGLFQLMVLPEVLAPELAAFMEQHNHVCVKQCETTFSISY